MGVEEDRGVSTGGVNVKWKGLSLGAIDYYSQDIINIFYTEGKYTFPSYSGLGFSLSAQYANQGSNGDNLVTGSPFSTHQTGVKGEVEFPERALLTLAYTTTAKGDNMRSPWGGYPGYTSVQVQDFNRASEEAFMVKLAYDFTSLGLKDFTAYALMVNGWGAINPATEDLCTTRQSMISMYSGVPNLIPSRDYGFGPVTPVSNREALLREYVYQRLAFHS